VLRARNPARPNTTDVTVHIVPAYAALFALFFVALSLRCVQLRRSLRVGIGDGGDERLRRAARAHANFAEYTPLGLLLFFFVELQGGNPAFVHALCVALLAGRVIHAFGVSRSPEPLRFRVTGMALTFGSLIVAALRLLVTTL
jgi:uncharacterized membrane protein YecN with MAPEG domain